MSRTCLDTWPERNALPMLRRVLEQLEFVEGGLWREDERQVKAAASLAEARGCVMEAIAAIDGAKRATPMPSAGEEDTLPRVAIPGGYGGFLMANGEFPG